MNMNANFTELSRDEMMETNGGSPVVVAVIVICVLVLALGGYNGYMDTIDQKR